MRIARFVSILLAILAVSTSVSTASPVSPAEARFAALSDEIFDGIMARRPTWAARLGLHAFDGQLPDHSPQGVAATLSWIDESLGRLDTVDSGALPALQRAEHATLRANLSAWAFDWRERSTLARDPRALLSAVSVAGTMTRDYAALHVRARAAQGIADAAPSFLQEGEARLERALPKTVLETAIAQTRGTAAFVRGDVQAAFAELPSEVERTLLQESLEGLAAALDTYALALEGRRNAANSNFRLGDQRFLGLLERAHGFTLSLDRLEGLFEADLARNSAALAEAAHAIDPNASVADVVARVLANRPAASEVLSLATAQAAQLEARVRTLDLVTIPSDDRVAVVETPPYLRFNMAFLNAPGPFEARSMPSFYYITPPNPAWPIEQQQAYIPATNDLLFITVHEAWPGHFLQSLHRKQVPSRILRALGSSATSEGWAHYTEELAMETGLTQGPEARVGQLLNALLRDVRCLSALGLHTGRMSVERSERLFRRLAYQDPANARQQAWRGTFDPMYLIYTLGKLAIYEMREDVRAKTEAEGGTFHLREFHDAFLSFGNAPLPAIRAALLGPEAGPPLVR